MPLEVEPPISYSLQEPLPPQVQDQQLVQSPNLSRRPEGVQRQQLLQPQERAVSGPTPRDRRQS